MNTYLLFKSLHLISVISWMAGLLYLPRIFVYHSQNNTQPIISEVFKVMERKLFFYIMTPAMILSWLFGLLLIHEIGFEKLGQTWMILKLIFVGFHGQTILHSPKDKYSKQLGDGKLLSQLSKKKVIYNFRQNDLAEGGEGAPLSPIFHQLIVKEKKIDLPICILNIGGISNLTLIGDLKDENLISKDIGPGNCLIDEWMRRNKKGNYDKNGEAASIGKTNELILNQALEDFENIADKNINSFDVNDFEINFLRGLDLEDGASTITDFTSNIIASKLLSEISKSNLKITKIILCGGGRKNKTLIDRIKKHCGNEVKFETTDDYGVDGDFVESQAFAFLAIRSFFKLPISFPNTTGCKSPSTGGVLVKNF